MSKKLEVGLIEEKKEVVDATYTQEEEDNLYEALSNMIPRVFLDLERLDNIPVDVKKFTEGVKAMSEDCGKISALVNIGVPIELAVNYILAKEEGIVCKQALENNGRVQL